MSELERQLDEALDRQADVEGALVGKLTRDASLRALADAFASTVADAGKAFVETAGPIAIQVATQVLAAEAARRLSERG